MFPVHRLLPFFLIALPVSDAFSSAARADLPKLPAESVVLPGAGRGGRSTGLDRVAAAIAAGTWQPPKAGDEMPGGSGPPQSWRSFKIQKDTVAPQGAAYSFVPIQSATARTVILHAIGHLGVYVNGELRAGDVYGNGSVRLPIFLHEGTNHLLFLGGRGPISAKFEEPKGIAQLDLNDNTVPEFSGNKSLDAPAAVLVRNNTTHLLSGLAIEALLPGGLPIWTKLPPLLPLAIRKVVFRVAGPPPDKEYVPLRLRLLQAAEAEPVDVATFNLRALPAGTTHRRTFISDIDGSVQYYSLVPALPSDRKPGLVLTLHGASVEASGQAACFGRKAGLHVVAPTNRRPYGFDWEDWGRLDALEVLAHASTDLDTDPKRAYLTGHSMGGHGTWHLGVTYPGRFAAIGPSAGWVSFASYGGSRAGASMAPEQEPLRRAAAASDTLSLVHNLGRTGVYVLHGDADDNVPVMQARAMRKELSTFHPDFAYHEQPGAGHWWGNACVDWAPMFEFFNRHELPALDKVRQVDFRTANPAVSAECHWLTIEAQVKPLVVSHVELTYDAGKRSFQGTTENVARLSIDVAHMPANKPIHVRLDGQTLESPWPADGSRLWLSRAADKWEIASRPKTALKDPHRAGPFKEAFRNRMLFVYGTHGSEAENVWSLAKARFDAETFWYRGNGSVDIMSDTDFDPLREPDRNVILYGHEEMNTAWSKLLSGAPAQVRRGLVRIGQHEEKGDNLACLFAYPRPGSSRAMVAAIAGTGVPGLKLTDRQPYFASGVGFPDWCVLDPAGVRGSGFFDKEWVVTTGESAWRK